MLNLVVTNQQRNDLTAQQVLPPIIEGLTRLKPTHPPLHNMDNAEMMMPDHPPLHNTICTTLPKLGRQHLPVMSQPPLMSIIQLMSTSTVLIYFKILGRYLLQQDKDLRICLAMTIIPNLIQHLPPITHHHLHPMLDNTIMPKIASTAMISAHHNLPNHPLMLVISARHQIHRHVLQTLRKRPP